MQTTQDSKTMHVPQFRSFVDRKDYEGIARVFDDNYIAEGKVGVEFRDTLVRHIGAEYGVLASNGTLALYLALKALGIGPGDEVIVQDTTFIATANAVEMIGATPIFVDILSATDPSIDLAKIVVAERTRAIMIAHLFGTACSNIEAVANFCKENSLFLIEDAAQAFDIRKKGGQHCGTWGDIGTFSFFADKTITTGEGGLVVTNDAVLHERMMYLRNQGRLSSGTFVHPEIGFNFRMTDIQSALGLAQYAKLKTIVKAKTELYARYQKNLHGKVKFLSTRPDFSHIPFRVVVFVDEAERVMEEMKSRGIEPRSVFFPMHRQPCFSHYQYDDSVFPNANACFDRGICLPTWIGLSDEQIDFVCEVMLEAI